MLSALSSAMANNMDPDPKELIVFVSLSKEHLNMGICGRHFQDKKCRQVKGWGFDTELTLCTPSAVRTACDNAKARDARDAMYMEQKRTYMN